MKKPKISSKKAKIHTDDDKFGIKWFYNLNIYYMKTFLMDIYNVSPSWIYYLSHEDKKKDHYDKCKIYHKKQYYLKKQGK